MDIATIRKRHVIIRGRRIPFVTSTRFFDVVSEGATVAALRAGLASSQNALAAAARRPHRGRESTNTGDPGPGRVGSVAESTRSTNWSVSFTSDASTFAVRDRPRHTMGSSTTSRTTQAGAGADALDERRAQQPRPCLEIRPRRVLTSDSRCRGVRPAVEHRCSGVGNRLTSPISATRIAAIVGPMPLITCTADSRDRPPRQELHDPRGVVPRVDRRL